MRIYTGGKTYENLLVYSLFACNAVDCNNFFLVVGNKIAYFAIYSIFNVGIGLVVAVKIHLFKRKSCLDCRVNFTA